MGRDKSTLVIGGVTLLGRIVSELSSVAGLDRIVVVGSRTTPPESALGSEARHNDTIVEFVGDRWPGEGPLGGLVTGLEHLHGPGDAGTGSADVCVAVLSCDLPNLTGSSLTVLFEKLESDPGIDMVMSMRGDRPQPLHAALRARCLPGLSERFDRGERQLLRSVQGLAVTLVPDESGSSEDADTPEDWERLVSSADRGSTPAPDVDSRRRPSGPDG